MPQHQEERSLLSQFAFTIRLIIVVYSALLLASGVWAGVESVTYLLLFTQCIATFGIVSPVPRGRTRTRRIVGLISLAVLAATILLGANREAIAPQRGELLSLAGIDRGSVGDIVSERDMLAIATRFLPLVGGLSITEAADLLPAISKLYPIMESDRGRYTSPLLPSLVGAPLLFGSEVLAFSSQESARSKRAVVFLHGTGGNIGLLCWIISRMGSAIQADTYCPSLDPLGMWGSDRGREIVSELLTTLSIRGKSEIYLVGISAGAVGAASLAREFESQLCGVALVNGAGPAIWDTKLPILFVYGRSDERFPPNLIAWIAKRTASDTRSVMISEVDGDHLLAIKQHETLYTIVVEWLRNLTATGAVS